MASDNERRATAAIAAGEGAATLFSMDGRTRLETIFRRQGLNIATSPADAPMGALLLIANADYAFDERVIDDFAARGAGALVVDNDAGEQVVVAVIASGEDAARWVERVGAETPAKALADEISPILTVNEVSGFYNRRLRKREEAVVVKATEARRDAIERRMFKGSYKGATDIVTKFVLPEPALHATRLAAALKLSPNSITFVSLLLVFAVIYLFMRGDFLLGAALGWLMCFLDTVDGKLARVTLQSSPFGNLFDHGIDLIHPPFWYAAWAAGAVALTTSPGETSIIWTAMWIINIGYVVGRLLEGYFLRRFKIEIHIWRKLDYWFRHITARRNPNLLMLTVSALFAAPALGLYLVALWTVISTLFHAVRIVTAELFIQNGGVRPLTSWLAE